MYSPSFVQIEHITNIMLFAYNFSLTSSANFENGCDCICQACIAAFQNTQGVCGIETKYTYIVIKTVASYLGLPSDINPFSKLMNLHRRDIVWQVFHTFSCAGTYKKRFQHCSCDYHIPVCTECLVCWGNPLHCKPLGLDHIGVYALRYSLYTLYNLLSATDEIPSLPRYITWMSFVAESKSYSV